MRARYIVSDGMLALGSVQGRNPRKPPKTTISIYLSLSLSLYIYIYIYVHMSARGSARDVRLLVTETGAVPDELRRFYNYDCYDYQYHCYY